MRNKFEQGDKCKHMWPPKLPECSKKSGNRQTDLKKIKTLLVV